MSKEQRSHLWQNIPTALQQYPQWCVCGYEYDRDSPKRPFNPSTQRPASTIDPSGWVTFEQAVESGASNIGFMLTADDPFFVVDLDTYKSGAPENHKLLLGGIETYAEWSQSGEGAHVIGMGAVGNGRNSRAHAIEIYDRDRFIIMTGNRINGFDIVADQPFADMVMELLGPIANAEARNHPPSEPSEESDEALLARMAQAENGRKFSALVDGNVLLVNGKDGEGHLHPQLDALRYESQSEADLALIEMLCFFTPDDEQVIRIFLTCALGQREKARQRGYIRRSIRRARTMIASNSLPPLDLSGLIEKARAATNISDKPTSTQQPGVILTRVSDVSPQPISWLWRDRIAEGKVTVIAGHPGLGKSQLTAFLAAKVTTGGAWPNDEGSAPVGAVIMLSCEDDIADTIRPRLEAAGADISKVHVIEGVNSGRGERNVFSVKKDMIHLESALAQVDNVKLVVIDPITAYLDGSDSHNTADVRAALAPLQDLAMRRRVAVVVVSHLNKSGGQGRSINAVTGSIAFVAASRATFLVDKDADEPERRLFLEIKNNLSHANGLAFYIRERVLENGIRAPYLDFQPGTVEITADEALSHSSTSGRGTSALEDARLFIIEKLHAGPVSSTEMKDSAEEEGIASKTLRKARVELGIITRKEPGINGVWMWSLPLADMKANMP